MGRIRDLALVVILMGIASLSMLLPALHAFVHREMHVARSFFYGAILMFLLTTLIAVATASIRPRRVARWQLISLVGAYLVVPLVCAVPFQEAVRNTTFFNAWFEMVSSFTTTGATLYPEAERLGPTLHLWRATVGWLGGFFVWVTAVALLAPMNLGGFEVTADERAGRGLAIGGGLGAQPRDAGARVAAVTSALLPVYAGLTGFLWLLLFFAGSGATAALIHAMATISTSGISGTGGLAGAGTGFGAEFSVAAFMVFALSRSTFTSLAQAGLGQRLAADHELRLGLLIVATVPAFLFLRHFIGAVEIDDETDVYLGLKAAWGSVFTVLSFLTTTGFVSADWAEARSWSGLPTPGVLLMGLAVLGGGVATTAGGVKLLRIWALYTHSAREMERLVHPSSVGGAGQSARRLRRQGAEIAWIFFMLFALSIALLSGAFSLAGLDFETSMILTLAGLSTTGPLIAVAGEAPVQLITLAPVAKGILMAAMVLGRLETLALIALVNPDFWRN